MDTFENQHPEYEKILHSEEIKQEDTFTQEQSAESDVPRKKTSPPTEA